ncbi:MAG TPA: DUF6370 family protein [Candidatus Sulfotelmatobacter sp.]|jgi:hypothetical protein|nr:DUF6370 family protein [Candidatus Sulfotelmatobacter sp.]
MKPLRSILALVAVLGLAGLALAQDAKPVTVSGKLTCAKCELHEAGMKDCQNVLVTEQGGKTVNYYVMKNDVAKQFGHACKGSKEATVTGTVSQKDGKTWITATKMEPKGEATKS